MLNKCFEMVEPTEFPFFVCSMNAIEEKHCSLERIVKFRLFKQTKKFF